MEGYLQRWINLIYRWRNTYFILHNDILIYLDKKGGQKKGSIHLKIASISLVADDPLKIIINSGTVEIVLKAQSIADKIKWVNALRESQEINFEQGLSVEEYEKITKSNNKLSQKDKSILLDSNVSKINNQLVQIWENQAFFDENLSLLIPHLNKQPELVKYAEKLEKYAHYLKTLITSCVTLVEDERKRVYRAANYFSEESSHTNGHGKEETNVMNQYSEFFNNNQQQQYASNDDVGTVFESFIGDSEDNIYKSSKTAIRRTSSQSQNQIQGLSKTLTNSIIMSNNEVLLNMIYQLQDQPLKYKLFTENETMKKINLTNEFTRNVLPFSINPNEKINFFEVIRNAIGKDLSRIAVPVYFNQPLSMLQQLAQQMNFQDLLAKASQEDDPCVRMAYVMAFAAAGYSQTIDRPFKKPFNPILGETYELDFKDKQFKFISEQVSHHPPVSAMYAESNDYQYWCNSAAKQQFWGKSMEVKPLSLCNVNFKKHNEEIVFNKCTTTINNIIMGTLYIDNHGVMTFKNDSKNITGVLKLTERGWNMRNAYKLEGYVQQGNKPDKYIVKGAWNSIIEMTHPKTQEKTVLWTYPGFPPENGQYYGFDDFSLQLNHINPQIIKGIAPTDSRLRPDQRALEYGWQTLAASEKFRLEEKQRARRKAMEAKSQRHSVQWFEKVSGEEGEWKYKGGYWEKKETGFNTTDAQDIF